jgi:hypothetical protein
METDLFSTNNDPEDLSPVYVGLRNSSVCSQYLQELFLRCVGFLDTDFVGQFKRRESFYQRLWELFICDRLIMVKANLLPRPGKNKPGVDFSIRMGNESNKIIRIECVCPEDTNKENIKEFDTSIFCQIEGNNTCYTTVQSGIDDYIVSRYTNSLADKAKKFRKYKYSDEEIKILLVSGVILEISKGKRYGGHIQARSATPPKFLLKASIGVSQPKDFLGVVL